MKSPYVGALALTAVVAGLTGAFIGLNKWAEGESERVAEAEWLALVDERLRRDEPFLDTPLSETDDWEVNCPSMDGGAAASLTVDIDGGAHRTETVYVESSSATCVKVGSSRIAGGTGGASTSTRGSKVGSGCAAGTGLTIDARGASCHSTGAAVKVQVLGGRR